jgi:hypothetical protein
MVVGAAIGSIIGAAAPQFYDLLFGEPVPGPIIVGLFLGMGNASVAGVALACSLIIAVAIAEKGQPATLKPFTNNPRETDLSPPDAT